jgi:MoaA/NifB/PqqE/SkfB family radical SAM enzyme
MSVNSVSSSFQYELHLEITSKCTLKCPLCPRTEVPGTYKVTDLSLELIEKIVSTSYEFDNVALCGNHGDPIYHSNFFQVIDLLLKLPGAPRIQINTNGSYKRPDWWRQLGEKLRSKDRVVFGLDGLKDTCKNYRVNCDWDSAWNGLVTLKKHSKCKLRWQWILFKYNEHQLAEAKQLCVEHGIDDFSIVKSSRFLEDINEEPTISLEEARRRFVGA